MMIIFLLVAIVISFKAYREFKGMLYDRAGLNGGGVPNFGGMMGGSRQ